MPVSSCSPGEHPPAARWRDLMMPAVRSTTRSDVVCCGSIASIRISRFSGYNTIRQRCYWRYSAMSIGGVDWSFAAGTALSGCPPKRIRTCLSRPVKQARRLAREPRLPTGVRLDLARAAIFSLRLSGQSGMIDQERSLGVREKEKECARVDSNH